MLFLYIILGLILLPLLIALFMPSGYKVEKSILINAPIESVYKKIADLNYYREWNPWQKSEPDSTSSISGEPDTTGHRYSWEGKKIGIGSLTLVNRSPYDSVHFDLQFIKPFKSQADDSWNFREEAGGTRVVWRNQGQLPYPVGRLISPSLTKTLNRQFEEGLNNLKSLSESQPYSGGN